MSNNIELNHYFCIYCEHTCHSNDSDSMFNHYKCHMFRENGCELCDHYEYCSPEESDQFVQQCDHKNEDKLKRERIKPKDVEERINNIEIWIQLFLSYQKSLFGINLNELLFRNKPNLNCIVCQYLVNWFKNNGGDNNQIKFINQKNAKHCFGHVCYKHPSKTIKHMIRKVEKFIEIKSDINPMNMYEEYSSLESQYLINQYNPMKTIGLESIFDKEIAECAKPFYNLEQLTISETPCDTHVTSQIFEQRINQIINDQMIRFMHVETIINKLTEDIKRLTQQLISSGIIVWFSSNQRVPNGFLKCNGDMVSRVVYANLFQTIGTQYGSGDGSTTFTLPDLRGQFIRCIDNGRGIDSNREFGSKQSFDCSETLDDTRQQNIALMAVIKY